MTTFYLVWHADTGVRGIPGGESMLEVQNRFVGWMETIRPGETNSRFVTAVDQRPVEHRKHLFGSSNGIPSHWRQRKCHIEDF